MGFYNRFILPQVLELAMRQKNFVPFRERTAGAAHGRVLEIGIGSGLNLASYQPDIETVCGVDPSAELLAKASERVASVGFPVRLLEASSENLPLEDRSFDTIVMTFTLCSIPHPTRLSSRSGEFSNRRASCCLRSTGVRSIQT